MPKTKVSEYSSVAANNTEINGINIAEGCPPSGINNAIRELMAQLKDQQSGTDLDNFVVGGNLSVTGTTTLTGTTAAPTVIASDDSTKIATTAFVRDIIPTGVIVMWSGSIATIPTGWLLCNGSSGTPDLRNKFIIAANADDAGVAKTSITGSATQTGGSKDATLVSHTHTFSAATDTASLTGTWKQSKPNPESSGVFSTIASGVAGGGDGSQSSGYQIAINASHGHSVSGTTASAGNSATNANLVPYYSLAYIMKS